KARNMGARKRVECRSNLLPRGEMPDRDRLNSGKRAQPIAKPFFLAKGGAQLLPLFVRPQPNLCAIVRLSRKSMEPMMLNTCLKCFYGRRIRWQVRQDEITAIPATEFTQNRIHKPSPM